MTSDQGQSPKTLMKQAQIIYSGRVQGVGFRYTSYHYALDIGLKGWVRNLADGNVEICAQGDEALISNLCDHLERNFEGYVQGKEINYSQAMGQFDGFQIKY